mmetsp:Transcript_5005/g.16544  ORF Transcript_5005/g.16544 Transcript_5005/m.16544 type:complete len:248 (-) Transcript_5005:972-1715(-)
MPRTDQQALRRSRRGGRRGRDLPADLQPPQGCRCIRAKERRHVHSRGCQAYAGARSAHRQRWRRRSDGGLRHRGARQCRPSWHHGARLHLCLLRDARPRGDRFQRNPAAGQRRCGRAGGPHQIGVRLVARPDRPPLARSRQGSGRRQRTAKAVGRVPARGLVRGPQNQGQTRTQVGHPEVRPSAGTRAASARRTGDHLDLRGAAVCQGPSARCRRPPLLRDVGRPAEGSRTAARAWLQARRLRPRHL